MSSPTPSWLVELLDLGRCPAESAQVIVGGTTFEMIGGVLRERGIILSEQQDQTSNSFGFKWGRRENYESGEVFEQTRGWLLERYGDPACSPHWLRSDRPIVLDAGCGAGLSALALLSEIIPSIRYLGVDISTAVDVARTRFAEHGLPAAFLQADISRLPLRPASIDIIFSEGVLHHTDSTERALTSLARLLKPGGTFLFYVYRKKGPIREFTDDYIRTAIANLPLDEAWEKLMPLSKLGKALGDANVVIDVPEPVDVLGIPAGPINLQRLIYWHVFKAFYNPEMTLNEMNMYNFDWYSPKNASRHTPEEVRRWCEAAHLIVAEMKVEEAGITVVARKAG